MRLLAYLAGLALAPFVIFFLGAWLLALAARKYGRDPYAEASGFTYRFKEQDDELRKRTEKRREDAQAIRRQAVRLETRDRDQNSRIHLVGGGR